MPYIGNTPEQNIDARDRFAGTGSQTIFTTSRRPSGAGGALVIVNGVVQDALTYGFAGFTLTFTEAPPTPISGVSTNIEVVYLRASSGPQTVNWNTPIGVNSGTSDSLAVTYSPLIAALTDNLLVKVVMGSGVANTTTTPTFSPSGLTVKGIVDTDGNAISIGQLSGAFELRYSTALGKWKTETISANSVRYLPAGTGSVPTTSQAKLDETVSVFCAMTAAQKAGVLAKTYSIDVTAAINTAISIAAVLGKKLHVPAGGYLVTPATNKTDAGGSNKCAFPMVSNMHIFAEPGACFKIASGISTISAPINYSMFFSNEVLSNLTFSNLEMDMNGANNSTNGIAYTTAAIIFSGTTTGVAAKCDDVLIEKCTIRNTPGSNCIVAAQTNVPGVSLGKRWKIRESKFENVGLTCGDHSSIYLWATDSEVYQNVFTNDGMFNAITHRGGLVSCELHGSNSKYYSNTVKNYYQGVWIASNYTETYCEGTHVYGNTAYVSEVFADFYCTADINESRLRFINIHDNIVTISNDVVPDAVKQLVRIAAVKQPMFVNIHNNELISKETVKASAMVAMVVQPDQTLAALSINIHDNIGAGLNVGLSCYFRNTAGLLNIDSVSFENNKLGSLTPSTDGTFLGNDIQLYGTSYLVQGKVSALRVAGLEHPVTPITTDGAVGGRATVYGKALLDLPVTWSGVTIGNGGYSKKIALDTDTGHAIVDIGFTAGGSTTYSGNISPTITGLVADATATSSATHFKGGAALALPSLIFNTASAISLYTAAGAPFDSSQTTTDSYVFVNASFPCRSANI